jgi:hypothetical protein
MVASDLVGGDGRARSASSAGLPAPPGTVALAAAMRS